MAVLAGGLPSTASHPDRPAPTSVRAGREHLPLAARRSGTPPRPGRQSRPAHPAPGRPCPTLPSPPPAPPGSPTSTPAGSRSSSGSCSALPASATGTRSWGHVQGWLSQVRRAGAAAFDGVTEAVAGASVETLEGVLRTLTAYFHLVNKAEQIEIVRVNREREVGASAEAPRGESVMEAIADLKRAGRSVDEARALVARLDIQPTLTAHPTEARRRTVLHHQQEAAAALDRLTSGGLTPAEADAAEAEALNRLRLLLATDEVRPAAVTVRDEVRHGSTSSRRRSGTSSPASTPTCGARSRRCTGLRARPSRPSSATARGSAATATATPT